MADELDLGEQLRKRSVEASAERDRLGEQRQRAEAHERHLDDVDRKVRAAAGSFAAAMVEAGSPDSIEVSFFNDVGFFRGPRRGWAWTVAYDSEVGLSRNPTDASGGVSQDYWLVHEDGRILHSSGAKEYKRDGTGILRVTEHRTRFPAEHGSEAVAAMAALLEQNGVSV